ncbi:hypothetical protein G7085_11070 [Tessaracoccus sp. HDW20]|uniref:hypothetical protein n=1 Tax=Tessaracoccus coleopterorum TaxID=2714950 RepID=UPI0018D2A863|nr:hypothetical protein [Tessaracoccus coleopterorum]NHB84969.1 hypothetical protein [Tessaracoccus coleopterorum]
MSIITGATNSSEGLDLSHEVRLVRSALLYADRVDLLSPPAAMLAGIIAGTAQGGDFVLDVMNNLDDATLQHLSGGKDPTKLRGELQLMSSLTSLPRAERRRRLGAEGSRQLSALSRQFRQMMDKGAADMGTAMQSVWERAGAPDLEQAAEAGLLTIRGDLIDFNLPADQAAENFAASLQKLMEDPTNHLMFDEQMGGLTRRLLEERPELKSSLTPHTKRATLGSGLAARLPAFPDAPMAAILAARNELEAPLGRYRRAVGQMSARLAAGPVDNPQLATEIEDLWQDDVQPTLRQLSDGLSASAFVPHLLGQLPADGKVWSGLASFGVSFLQVGVGALAELTQPAALATGAGLVATSLGKAAKATIANRQDARSHGLYYLLALNERLA